MNVRRELLHVLEEAHSLAPILDAATRVISHRLDADRCCVFLVDQQGPLVRYGADLGDAGARDDGEMARLAAEVVARRIHFRLLDLGGDKFVASTSVTMARSAFHGYRSIRVLFDHPEVLRDQVQALAIAAGDRPLRILIPMVTSLEDLRRVKTLIGDALRALDKRPAQRVPEIGVMIEVPAAVEIAGEIAKKVDFLSIGTNDLMQYALVVDREDARMASLSDPYHPAILRMVARVIAAARDGGKTVGVCGEIAVRPDIALALMALGIDSISVVPTAILELKQALAGVRLAPLQQAIAGILALPDALSIAAALREPWAA